MRASERTTAQLGAVATAAIVLRKRCAIEALGFPDRFDVAQRFDLVASSAHELIGLGSAPRIRRRMFADQVFSFFAIVDAAHAALLQQQRFVLTRGEIETAHVDARLLQR